MFLLFSYSSGNNNSNNNWTNVANSNLNNGCWGLSFKNLRNWYQNNLGKLRLTFQVSTGNIDTRKLYRKGLGLVGSLSKTQEQIGTIMTYPKA